MLGIVVAFMIGGFCGMVTMALLHIAKESDQSDDEI
jgi:hypothetical protein